MDIRIVCDREQSDSLKVIFGALGKTPKEYPSRYDKNEVRFYIKDFDLYLLDFVRKYSITFCKYLNTKYYRAHKKGKI